MGSFIYGSYWEIKKKWKQFSFIGKLRNRRGYTLVLPLRRTGVLRMITLIRVFLRTVKYTSCIYILVVI